MSELTQLLHPACANRENCERLLYLERQECGARGYGNRPDRPRKRFDLSLAIANKPKAATDAVSMDLLPMVAAYGRDRRVALRVERMPSRARLTRGRNNGDGSWSLTRDELDDLHYVPPKGADGMPTLVVRIIGLDADNGATLAVYDHRVGSETEIDTSEADAEAEAEAENASQRETELRKLRAELAKARAVLKTTQADLAAARKSWDAELEQRLNDAADEAVATLEERRNVWMSETKERLLKAEARALERLEQARERWRHDTESELARAEEIWKSSEAMRMAQAQAHWQEQSARAQAQDSAQVKQLEAALAASQARAQSNASDGSEILRLRDEIAGLATSLAAAQCAIDEAREHARSEASNVLASAERNWKAEETRRLAAAEQKWREEAAHTLADETAKRVELEAELAQARAQASSGDARANEIARLQKELAGATAALAERDKTIATDRAAAERAREAAAKEAEAALAGAQESGSAEIARLRQDLASLSAVLADRDKTIAADRAAAERAREDAARETEAALAQAEHAWKGAEAERLQSAETAWQEHATRKTKEMASRLAQAEAALAEVNAGRERRETAETRRLRAELSVLRENHAESQERLVQSESAADAAREEAESARASLAAAEARWKKEEAVRFAAAETRRQEQSARVLAEVTAKLEKAEAAAAELRAGAKSTHERQDSAETRRLNAALAEAKEQLAARERALEAALDGARNASEAARREFEHALADAKKTWESDEASRLAEAKAQWKEQSDRLFKKATVRLEGAEAALANARTEANTARDRREGAELRRLRAEFAAMRTQLAEREADLSEAQVAASRSRESTREEVEAALLKAEESWKSNEQIRIAEAENRERERGARALSETIARLERTETALAEARAQFEAEKERAAVAAAEATARQERAESALQEAKNRIETLRDPANETELARLRTEVAALQVAHADREAELAQTRAAARKSRESWAERTQASVQRAEDLWRIEEAQRLEAARREWHRDARLAGMSELANQPPEPAVLRKAHRLVLDSALAVALVAIVVLGVTFYPQLKAIVTGVPATQVLPAAPPTPLRHTAAVAAPKARAVVGVALAKLRSDPSMSASIVETLARGTSVELAEQRQGWVRVRVAPIGAAPTKDGWVRANSLTHLASN